MIESIHLFDTELFLLINQANNSVVDSIMVFASGKFSWSPLYIILIGLLIHNYKTKAIYAVLMVIIAVGLSDLISVHLFKNVFQRLRPCYEPGLADVINNIVGCGGKYGFVSSHATNTFAIIIVVLKILGSKYKSLNWIMIVWGLLIIYSRVYLGKHYPMDVIAGSILGLTIGWIVYFLGNLILSKYLNKTDNNGAPFFHTK